MEDSKTRSWIAPGPRLADSRLPASSAVRAGSAGSDRLLGPVRGAYEGGGYCLMGLLFQPAGGGAAFSTGTVLLEVIWAGRPRP